jgi:hypothetical protein
MKYKLETIPVWDAYKENSECPLCLLANKQEQSYQEFYLGHSIMIPEAREEFNKRGFCQKHHLLLFQGENKLGLALVTHTRLLAIKQKLNTAGAGMLKELKKKVSSWSTKPSARLTSYLALLKESEKTCLFCEKIEEHMARYAYTILYMWQKEAEFKPAFQASKGFCLYHLEGILQLAVKELSSKNLDLFMEELLQLEETHLNRLDDELSWYIQKYDYLNTDKPWYQSKDALPRAIQKLIGKLPKQAGSGR